MNTGTYAGDVTPRQAWEMINKNPDAVLLDVRTPAEWDYVGLPDLSSLGRKPLFVPWQTFPAMKINQNFLHQVSDADIDSEQELLIICRSGVRSKSAAIALTDVGFTACYNVAYGFEGDKDPTGHRGTLNGWKADDLPWVQG